jgi:hypothetical protein
MTTSTAPSDAVWVPCRGWRTPPHVTRCAEKGCEQLPIAELDRWHGRTDRWRIKVRWVGWCEEHLGPYYRVENGVVLVAVGPGSPAALRGWTE